MKLRPLAWTLALLVVVGCSGGPKPPPPVPDMDGDGIADSIDNCVAVANADQSDRDGDGAGDACDECPADNQNDKDGDGVCGDVDNCPGVSNPDQADRDGNGKGDACDTPPPPQRAQYSSNPYAFDVNFTGQDDGLGGMIVGDLNGDGLPEYIITFQNFLAVHGHYGGQWWKENPPLRLGRADGGQGYPGLKAMNVTYGDVDNDGDNEVLYLTKTGDVRIRDGRTGRLERSYNFPGAQAMAVANFQGQGEVDLVVQYDQRRLRAFDLRDGHVLWQQDNWIGTEHHQVRVADLDLDGKDEVLGVVILDHRGRIVNDKVLSLPSVTRMNFDSLSVEDILGGPAPDGKRHLEVVLAEQGVRSRTIVLGKTQLHFAVDPYVNPSKRCPREVDADKLASGDFSKQSPGREIFARSGCANFPWVYDAFGRVLGHWSVNDKAPAGWYTDPRQESGGVDEVSSLNWVGDRDHILVTERHIDGKVAVVDAVSGNFVKVFDTKAARLLSADVSGDAREEIVVLELKPRPRVRIFWNSEAPNTNNIPNQWDRPFYKEIHRDFNYYSPD